MLPFVRMGACGWVCMRACLLNVALPPLAFYLLFLVGSANGMACCDMFCVMVVLQQSILPGRAAGRS